MTNIDYSKHQAIFDVVVAGLASQGWNISVNTSGGCQYRGVAGRKCAAGHLIPDADYDPAWEGNTVWHLPFFTSRYDSDEMNFLAMIQSVHDAFYEVSPVTVPALMKKDFIGFAVRHNLKVPA